MKYLTVLALFFLFSNPLISQIEPEEGCYLTTVQIGSSSEIIIVLRHAGVFIFPPTNGQASLWEVSTTKKDSILASGNEEIFSFDLPDHDVTIADSVVVDLTVTNTNGDVCFIKDTLIWDVVSVVPVDPPVEIYSWINLDSLPNGGIYTQAPLNTTLLPESHVTVYPNPSDGHVWIDWSSYVSQPTAITVHDATGRLIQHIDKVELGEEKMGLRLERSGTYILRIYMDDQVMTKRVVVE